MNKKTCFFIILLIFVMLLPSCKEEVGTTSLKLILKSDSTNSRLISNQGVDISYYRIIGEGPENNDQTPQQIEQTVTVPQTSVTLSGILIGNWTFTATAYNADNTPLMEGSVNVQIGSRPSPITINVNEPVGKGNISLGISWIAPEVTNPKIKVYLRGPDMSSEELAPVSPEVNNQTNSATYSASNLVSGSYIVRVELYNGTNYYGGKAETVKVFSGTTTTGSIELNYDPNNIQKDSSLTLQTNYGRPVQGALSPSGTDNHILFSTEEATLNFSVTSTAEINDADYTVEWYYDGKKQTTGTTALTSNNSTFQFTPYLGVHIVDVICYSNSYGSLGSAEWSFSCVAKGKPGSLFIQREISSGEGGVKLGAGTVIGGLPDDRYLVASPINHLLQLCSLSNNKLQVNATFDASWLSYVEHIFSDRRMNGFVIIDGAQNEAQKNENMTVMMYNPGTTTPSLSVLRDSKQAEMRYKSHAGDDDFMFQNLASAAYRPDQAYGGTILINDANSIVSAMSIFKFTASSVGDPLVTTRHNKKGKLTESSTIADTKFFYTLPGLSAVEMQVFDPSTSKFKASTNSAEISVKFAATFIHAISDIEFIISDGSSKTCIYKYGTSDWQLLAELNHPTSKICSMGNKYLYLLDNVGSTVYSYSLGTDGKLTEISRLAVEDISDMVCSDSSVLIAQEDGSLVFCKVVEE